MRQIFLLLILGGVILFFISLQANRFKEENQTLGESSESKINGIQKNDFISLNNNPTNEIPLEVYEPSERMDINQSEVVIRGKTVPLATVYINQQKIQADKEGNFSHTYLLDEGENYILLVAQDDQGLYSEREFLITMIP